MPFTASFHIDAVAAAWKMFFMLVTVKYAFSKETERHISQAVKQDAKLSIEQHWCYIMCHKQTYSSNRGLAMNRSSEVH